MIHRNGTQNVATLKVNTPLTKGWGVTSEPLDPKSKATFSDFLGCLNVKVKLKQALPDTTYTAGLNVYGADAPTLGSMSRFAFDPRTETIDGVSKRLINRYDLGTVTTNERGKAKFKRVLPVNPGTYDVQVWVAKGPLTDVPVVCYKSGKVFGDSDAVSVYDPVSCEKTSLSFVITGCGRSGTRFTSRLLSALGVPCGHEEVFDAATATTDATEWVRPGRDVWGDSSWLAGPILDHLPKNTIVFHQIRNPVKVVRSLMGMRFFERPYNHFRYQFTRFALRYLPEVESHDPPLLRCMKHWIHWNLLVERMSSSGKLLYHRYRLEDLSRVETGTLQGVIEILGHSHGLDVYRRALEAVPHNTNAGRPDPTVQWSSLPDGDCKDWLSELALKYGYSRKELEGA